jgi:hypothetical protein
MRALQTRAFYYIVADFFLLLFAYLENFCFSFVFLLLVYIILIIRLNYLVLSESTSLTTFNRFLIHRRENEITNITNLKF